MLRDTRARLRLCAAAALVGLAASPAKADWISDAFGAAEAGGTAFMSRAPQVQMPSYGNGGGYQAPPPAYLPPPPPPVQYGNPFVPPPQNFTYHPSTGYSGPPIQPNPQLYNPGNWATVAPTPPPPQYLPPAQPYYYPHPPVTGFQPPMYQLPRR